MTWNPSGDGVKPKYQHKENRGSVFDNDHKTTEKHPDFTGSANINGIVYWVSGWTSMTKDNKRKMSLSFTRQEDRPAPIPSQPRSATKGGW